MPWQLAPLHYANHLDSALREPFGDPRGPREAAEVLKKTLALGLSRFEPDPLRAIAEPSVRPPDNSYLRRGKISDHALAQISAR